MKIARKDHITDNYFGVKVEDPYRWLEDPENPDTISWVEEQNRITFDFLEKIRERKKIKDRLTELWNYPKYSIPVKKGIYYFFEKNDGLQNQAVLYRIEGLHGKQEVVIDPNKIRDDGTAALSRVSYNKDGTLVAYGISYNGSDWHDIFIKYINSGKIYDEVLKWSRGGGMSWKHDNSGFYYNRYPDPATVPEEKKEKYNRVYFHKIGTAQKEDELVFEIPEKEDHSFYPFVTDDGKYLILHISPGCIPKNGIYYKEIDSTGPFIKLLEKEDAMYNFIDNINSTFYFQTDLNSPRARIIAIDINNPGEENWQEIIPEMEDVIDYSSIINNQLVILYLHHVHNKLKTYDLSGKFIKEINLPTIGTVGELLSPYRLSGKRDDREMFFSFTSFLYPRTIFRYDFEAEKMQVFRDPGIDFDPSGYETKQIFYHSKDGTKIPMFITHKKGIALDGNNPTLMGGYGGFNISLTPGFGVSLLVWMEMGGIYALPGLRGGGEYGEDWHQAGMLHRKQNVFDDFISAGKWLIENKYTKPEKLAISGGSNGGLLVAACMVQRPKVFGAVICKVPLTDMLRYHKFTIGYKWIPEYGNPENSEEEFKYIHAYSPLHNIKEGEKYPPILIATADTDDRVVPAHAKKFAAALLDKSHRENLILLRIETKAGHGQGKPTSKLIDDISDVYAFLFKMLGMKRG